MKFKFLQLASAVSATVALLALAGLAEAQAPVPARSPASQGPRAHIRLWNMVLVPALAAPMELVSSGSPAAALLAASPANFTNEYLSVMPGHYALSVFRTGDRNTPLKTFDVTLQDKNYSTFYVHVDDQGKIVGDMLDETQPPDQPVTNKLTVRQLSPGVRVLTTVGTMKTGLLENGQTEMLDNLPGGNVPVSCRTITAKGPRNWTVEVDFSRAHQATVFLVTDAYGRMRPRVTSDGPSKDEDAKPAAQ